MFVGPFYNNVTVLFLSRTYECLCLLEHDRSVFRATMRYSKALKTENTIKKIDCHYFAKTEKNNIIIFKILQNSHKK